MIPNLLICYTFSRFIKLTRAGGHSFAPFVESFRNEQGKPRQRTVATIGRVDDSGGAVDSLLNSLLLATGRQPLGVDMTPQVQFESALPGSTPNVSY